MAKTNGITAIPTQSIMLIVKATVTSTSLATVTNTASTSGNGYSAAVLGGSLAGIAVGLIVLGAVLYVIISNRRYRREGYDRGEGPVVVGKTKTAGKFEDIPGGRVATID